MRKHLSSEVEITNSINKVTEKDLFSNFINMFEETRKNSSPDVEITNPINKVPEKFHFSPSIPVTFDNQESSENNSSSESSEPSEEYPETYSEESDDSSEEETSSSAEDITLAERKDLPDSNSGSMIDMLRAINKDFIPKMKDEVPRSMEKSTPIKFCGKEI